MVAVSQVHTAPDGHAINYLVGPLTVRQVNRSPWAILGYGRRLHIKGLHYYLKTHSMKRGKPALEIIIAGNPFLLMLYSLRMSESSTDSNALAGKTIVLGVSGSIAAYKAADLTSELRRLGADVFVVMTRAASEFIGPITLQTLSRNPVVTDLWKEGDGWQPGHIELADKADLLLVALLRRPT